MNNIVNKNGEILFIYDAETCNPNGDPDDENRPRMDYATSTNLVSDVRLKRYIRDYLEKVKNQNIYLTNPYGFVLNASDRLSLWLYIKDGNEPPKDKNDIDKIRKDKKLSKEILEITKEDLISSFIDIRLFGATIPLKNKKNSSSGKSITLIGPIQFNWGKSFNKVKILSSTVTTHLSSEEGSQGSMGIDHRVYYSLIGFHGIISAIRSEESGLTWDDIELFDEAMIKSIPSMATRSKIGQYPRLYLRLIYNSDNFFIDDLRKYITINQDDNLRSIKDLSLDLSKLRDILVENVNNIEKIIYYCDENIKESFNIINNDEALSKKMETLKIS